MSITHEAYFDYLERQLAPHGIGFSGKQTKSGRNVYERRAQTGELIEVTANFAPRDDRISNKITINAKGAAPRMFNAFRSVYQVRARSELDGMPTWEPSRTGKESKFQIERRIAEFPDVKAMADWAVPQILALINEARSL